MVQILILVATGSLLAGCAGESPRPVPMGDSGPVLDGTVYKDPDAGPRPNPLPNPQQDSAPPPPPPPPDSGPPPPPPPPPDPCKGNESHFNGYCYIAVGYKWMDYQTASGLCAANGGKVASILSQAENQFVYGLLPALNQAAWIGLKRTSGAFSWVDGHPKGFVNWAPGEPNNESGQEECSVMWGPHLSITAWRGKWNDVPCANPGRDTVICKRKP